VAAVRLSVRKINEVLRLHHERGLSARQIARSCGIGRTTVAAYLSRAKAAGLGWPLPADLDHRTLEERLFPPEPPAPARRRPLPDWAEVHRDLKRRKQTHVTLQLLWEEYKAAHPHNGFQYSWFCNHYRAWTERVDLVMRQDHRAGEKLFVDYAGQTVPIIDPKTGEIHEAQIFVAVLGASSYTFSRATWTQTLPDWIDVHVRALEFFGGCPEILVPDNPKPGVKHPHLYEPDLNPTYQDMATHYGIAVIPARVRRPRDKAKAEAGVLLVERWILARLRKQRFFSLDELNAAIAELLILLNDKPFQKLPGSRRSLFEQLDRPALRPLPALRYAFSEWKTKRKVHIDYHVEVDRHYYSVPHQLRGQRVDARYTRTTVEVFHRGRRVASHRRSYVPGHHTTVREHMPPSHQHVDGWSPERFHRWADTIGAATRGVVDAVFASRRHPQQGYRTCLGILRLADAHGADRLEAACRRALRIGTHSYKSVSSILDKGLDRRPFPDPEPVTQVPADHDNVRGSTYYQ
jgi:transposase